jgi:hypothetical protein
MAANKGPDIRNSTIADRNLDIWLQSGNPLVDQAPEKYGQEACSKLRSTRIIQAC